MSTFPMAIRANKYNYFKYSGINGFKKPEHEVEVVIGLMNERLRAEEQRLM